MILQALCAYYQALCERGERGEIEPFGWEKIDVSYALDLDANGALRGVIPLKNPSQDGKKELPQTQLVPEHATRTRQTIAYFLCDNISYLLGIDDKGKPEKTAEHFEAAQQRHRKLLRAVDSPAARAVCAFFETWQPAGAAEHPALLPYMEEIRKNDNLIFTVDGQKAQEDPAIREAWTADCARRSAEADTGLCLVTGQHGPIARLHKMVRGIRDAQPSGAALVSFNVESFESYGYREGQGLNAHVSEDAAFRYGTALKYLIADRQHCQYIGDTAVVYWAEDAQPLCQDLFSLALFGGDEQGETVTNTDLERAVRALARGEPVEVSGVPLEPANRFFVLGLAPNASRLSVRFFLQSSFGDMLAHAQAHADRLAIVKPTNVQDSVLNVRQLLHETVRKKDKDKQNGKEKPASPPMAGAVMRAILSDEFYPMSLFEETMLRTRAEQDVTYGRAAILKAFFLKNKHFNVPEEVLQVELNEQSNVLPYVLGRLFAVLERVQQVANPDINTTIKARYFNSACATPAVIFPLLTKLSQSHLRKLDEDKKRIFYEKQIGDLEGRIHETLPMRLTLPEQGTFHLGYYHQVQKFFEKKTQGGNEHV